MTLHTSDDAFDLLCALLQGPAEDGNDVILSDLDLDRVDWDALAGLASYHGVAPLLYARLSNAAWPGSSHAVQQSLQRLVGLKGAHGLFLVSQLATLSRSLQQAEIPHLVIKGPALAATAYPSIAVRSFGDLDLLIDRSDFSSLEDVFLSSGLTQRSLTEPRKRLYLAVHGQYSFARAVPMGRSHGHLTVDVHTSAFPPGYAYRYRYEELLSRGELFHIGGSSFLGLSPEDALAQLAFHGFKDRWNRLKFVVDVAELIRNTPSLNWEELHRRARAGRWCRVMQLSWLLAADLLSAPIPPHLLDSAREDPHVVSTARLAEQYLRSPFSPDEERLMERVRFNMAVQDHLGGKLRYATYAAVRRLSDLVLTDAA